MTPQQLHLLKPGDTVYWADTLKDRSHNEVVEGVVVYLDKDSQTVDAVKIDGTLYQREEMLQWFKVTRQGARRRG